MPVMSSQVTVKIQLGKAVGALQTVAWSNAAPKKGRGEEMTLPMGVCMDVVFTKASVILEFFS